jgi:hypothetical protein
MWSRQEGERSKLAVYADPVLRTGGDHELRGSGKDTPVPVRCIGLKLHPYLHSETPFTRW